MSSTYATTRTQCAGVTFAATSGGSLTGSGTIYLAAQYRTRQGLSLHSTIATISYTAGQKIVATIASTAIATGEAGAVHEIVISGAASNSASAMVRLAAFQVLQADQITSNSLPATVELSRDAHIALSQTVANSAALPSGSDRLNGMVRYVTADSLYKVWDGVNTAWITFINWTGAANGFTTYIGGSTENAGGCDRPIQAVPAADIITMPAYNPDNSASTAVRLVYLNGLTEDGGSAIEVGQPIGVVITQGGVDASIVFSNKIVATYRGLFRKSTGTINTSNSMVGIAQPVQTFTSASGQVTSNLEVPENIPRGYGALFTFHLQFRADEVLGIFTGQQIKIYFSPQSEASTYDPSTITLGAGVTAAVGLASGVDDGLLRILPLSNAVQSLAGAASLPPYRFQRAVTRTATGLDDDLAGQKIAMSATLRGDIFVRAPSYTLTDVEYLRAVVSTEAGTYTASGWSSVLAVGSSQAFQVTVSFPDAIRSDYPDVIAGTPNAYFNVPQMRVFVRVGGSTIYEYTTQATVLGGSSTSFIISDLTGMPTVGSLPTNGDTEFCLFDYAAVPSIALSGVGALTAGNYEVAVAWYFPSPNTQVTKISHSTTDGCIPELGTTLASALESAKYWNVPTVYGSLPSAASTTQYQIRLDPSTKELNLNNGTSWETLSSFRYWRPPVASVGALPAASSVEEGCIIQALDTGVLYTSDGVSAWTPVTSSGGADMVEIWAFTKY